MKTSLRHLPQATQDQILQITEVIKDVISPEKIILFGSYSKGTQVEDVYFEKGIRYEYLSDYDFLVIPKDNLVKEYVVQDKVVNRFRHFKTPVNIIVHDINYVNEGLSEGQYFFSDIIKEGILLHNTENFEFLEPRELSDLEKKLIAQRYFDKWYSIGNEFLIDTINAYNRGSLNKAAFELHQATENFYNSVLLVFTGYKPKTHNLDKLRQYAKHISEDLFAVFPFPEKNEIDKHLFDLLKRGYIDARYKEDYIITEEELVSLLEKVEALKQVIQTICLQKISAY